MSKDEWDFSLTPTKYPDRNKSFVKANPKQNFIFKLRGLNQWLWDHLKMLNSWLEWVLDRVNTKHILVE